MILLYTILYAIALIIIFPLEYFKRPKELRGKWLAEKLGNVGRLDTDSRPTIWIHAVSVGEVLAAIPLIRRLQESGHRSIVLSMITDTGRQIAYEKSPKGIKIIYLPFDLKIFLKKAVRMLSPDLFMTMETELWPNLFHVMKNNDIPAFIFNGRISDMSFPRYRKIRFFLKQVFDAVQAAGMQTRQDAERIREMGMDEMKINIIGNFKFDIQGTLKVPEWTGMIQGATLVAGSTHEGEEDMIIDVYLKLKEKFPSLNLILAPRHPQRFPRVETLLRQKSIPYQKRSSMDKQTNTVPEKQNSVILDSVVLVDVLGELAGIYSIADVCIIGGSFVPIGGHNLFEAAYWSKAIICGPYMNNFPLAKEFQQQNAARIVENTALYDTISRLLESSDERIAMGRNAHNIFLENRGAVEKAINILNPYIERTKA